MAETAGSPAPAPTLTPAPVVLREDRLDYTPVSRSVPSARRRVARLVVDWGAPELAGDIALVVSELMTNALLHGTPSGRLVRVHLSLRDGGVLRLEVGDPRGKRLPRPRPPGEDSGRFGRGLLLVGALTDRWGWEPRTVGKVVYAEWVPRDRPALPAMRRPGPQAEMPSIRARASSAP
ncbi:ATP-binding protein [Streptomyces sp. ZYX-F-203]|uniref:ATP-binding protein n=1 Tax=Streptomyces sp. HSG2 TaxID=2797167 RepID=UPI0019032158|nr:ATP-binding protein [Streptomyces sp. HSG2]